MKNDFYTNVAVLGNNILYRGIRDGKRIRGKIPYRPTLYVASKKPTEYKTLFGDYVDTMRPGGIKECREFVEQYKDVSGFTIYGNTNYQYAFISDAHPNDIEWDIEMLNIAIVDIEVASDNGFPEPTAANEEITAITIKLDGKYHVFGCGAFDASVMEYDVQYVKCSSEVDLLKRFLDHWTLNYPDIVTGWNIKFFDFPYLVNRINKILGEKDVARLSPWGRVNDRTVTIMGRANIAYEMLGIATLDYIEMYRKFAPGGVSQESYKLNNIANVEIGEKKISYEEYDNLHTLYRENYQKFIEYNIHDVRLVEKLDDKLKLIELALTLAYDSKTNYEDVFTQVRMWDALIYNHLRKKNIVIPPKNDNEKNAAYEGAFVKDPLVGMHSWMASFDLNSLYPHLIMQYNLSPETLVQPSDYTDEMHQILRNRISVDELLARNVNTSALKELNVTLTPNKQFFRTDIHGFLPEMMERMYDDRSVYKKKAIEAKKELETCKDEAMRYEIEKRIARYNNLQLAKKVSLNSAYGAMGNQYFRFFDIRIAEAITLAGQLSIRWIELRINEYMNKLLKTENVDYVVASDTDSIYLTLDTIVRRSFGDRVGSADPAKIIAFMDKVCETKIQPYIDEVYQDLASYMNAYAQKMQMKREALADRGIWTAKKRYIMNVYNNEGVQYAKPKLKVMGLEMIKSSTPAAIREKMKDAIEIILRGSESDVQNFIEKFKDDFKNLPPEEISFPRGVTGMKDYADASNVYKKGTPIHVKGALLYNNLLQKHKLTKKYPKIQEGEKLRFTYLRLPNVINDTVISYPGRLPPEFDLHRFVDYDLQFDKAFIEPLKSILDCVGWKAYQESDLTSFFS